MEELHLAIEDFIEREKESSAASFTIPFVTVNSRTNIVAIHSRLLFALQLSVEKSVEKLGIPESEAFDKVGCFTRTGQFIQLDFGCQKNFQTS